MIRVRRYLTDCYGVRHWRWYDLPRYLPPEAVGAVIVACGTFVPGALAGLLVPPSGAMLPIIAAPGPPAYLPPLMPLADLLPLPTAFGPPPFAQLPAVEFTAYPESAGWVPVQPVAAGHHGHHHGRDLQAGVNHPPVMTVQGPPLEAMPAIPAQPIAEPPAWAVFVVGIFLLIAIRADRNERRNGADTRNALVGARNAIAMMGPLVLLLYVLIF